MRGVQEKCKTVDLYKKRQGASYRRIDLEGGRRKGEWWPGVLEKAERDKATATRCGT